MQVSDYFRSGPCLNEIRRSHKNDIPIVFLLETDPTHGGVPMEVHKRDCPDYLQALLASAPVVEWHRVQVYQDVSLRRLAREVLHIEAAERKLSPSDEGVYHPREIIRQPIKLGEVGSTAAKRFHIYASRSNPGAAELASELQAHAQAFSSGASLVVCDDPTEMQACQHVLLYLNRTTHNGSSTARALYGELSDALNKGVHILLAHEQRPDKGGTTFKDIIDTTPVEVRDELDENGAYVGKRLYKELAVGICGGSHQPSSLHLLLGAVASVPVSAAAMADSFHGQGDESNKARRRYFPRLSIQKKEKQKSTTDSVTI